MFRQRPRWLKILAIALAAIILLALAADPIFGLIFRSRLAAAIEKEMGAKLQTSGILYRPPFGLVLFHPRITLPAPTGESVEIFSAERVVLRLGRLPHKHKPLLIRDLSVRKPVVRLVKTPRGWLFRTEAAKQNAEKREAEEVKTNPPEKSRPSDRFRLNVFSMSDARLICADRTRDDPSERTVLQGLSASIHPAEASKSDYCCRVWSVGPRQLNTNAAVDIDHRSANIDELLWEFDLGQLTQLSLSSKTGTQASGRIDGKLRVEMRGHLGMNDRSRDDFEGTFELKGGSAHLPEWKLDLEKAAFKFRVQAKKPSGRAGEGKSATSVTIQSVSAVSAGLMMKLNGGVLSIDENRRWKLDDLLGYIETEGALSEEGSNDRESGCLAAFMRRTEPRGRVDFTAAASGPWRAPRSEDDLGDFHWKMVAFPRGVKIRFPKFPLPFEHVGGGGTVSLRDGFVELKNLTGNYGFDQYVLDNARLVLFDPTRKVHLGNLKERVKFQEISGEIDFKQPASPYPGGFGKVVAQLRPSGTFAVGGSYYTFHPQRPGSPKPPRDYEFDVSSNGGNFKLKTRDIALTDIRGESTVAPARIDLKDVGANVLGGTVVVKGHVIPKKLAGYDGTISLTNVDLAKLAAQLKLREPKHGKIDGRAFANITLKTPPIDSSTQPAAATALQRLTADGEFEILQADFYPIPILEDIIPTVRRGEAKTVGDAAGVFSIANETITLKSVAINSPALGLEGSGTIGFNKTLNLDTVATPLGNWSDKLKESRLPIVSEVAADIVKAVQKVVNAAQGALLYRIQVTGTTDHPVVKTVPAPVITDSVALIFGQMLQPEGKPHRLLESLRQPEKK